MKNIQKFLILNAVLFSIAIVLSIFGDQIFRNISITPTPTPPPVFEATIKQPSFCYNGPSENYPIAVAIQVPVDTVVEPLGVSSDKNWFLVQGPEIGRCWIKTSVLSYSFDPGSLIPIPTPLTTRKSNCYTDPNRFSAVQTTIPKGWIITVSEKNSLSADWVFITPHDSTVQCWVMRDGLTSFDLSMVPVANTPSAPPTSQP